MRRMIFVISSAYIRGVRVEGGGGCVCSPIEIQIKYGVILRSIGEKRMNWTEHGCLCISPCP